MPRNGTGTYSAPSNSWNPPVDTTEIDSEDWQETLDDIEDAISASIAKDGQTTTTAFIPLALGTRVGPGSAGAPSLSFIVDTDLGAYRIASDVLGIAAGGSEKLRIETALAKLSLPTLLMAFGAVETSLETDGSGATVLEHSRSTAGDVRLGIDPKPSDGSGDSEVALFRGVTTTGARKLNVYKGNGSATAAASFTVNSSANGLDWDGVHKWPATHDEPIRHGETRVWRGSNGHPRWLSSADSASADGGAAVGIISQSLSTPGFVRFAGGFIVQWGTDQTNSSGEASTTFPITFPNSCIWAGPVRVTSSSHGLNLLSLTTTGATFVSFNTTTGATVGAGFNVRWLAVGW